MDRHLLWRKVGSDYQQLEQIAPDGFEPSVELFLIGRQEPVELGFVATSRAENDPLLRLQARSRASSGESDATRDPHEYWVHVHESLVERVEIRFVRTGRTTPGFSYRDVDEKSSSA